MIILCEFELPCAASNDGIVKCSVRQEEYGPDRKWGTLLGLRIDTRWDFDRSLRNGWQVEWVGWGGDLIFSTVEKTLIEKHLQRLYKLRAFL